MSTPKRDELEFTLAEVARLLSNAPPPAKPAASELALEQERKLRLLLRDVERLLEKQKADRRSGER